MNVDIIEMPELRVATVSHRGPYHEISEAFARLGHVAGVAGFFGPSAAMLGIYYDDPRTTLAADLRSEAGITISADTRLPEELGETRIPAGRFARTTHVGPYEELSGVWPRLMSEWLAVSGHRRRDAASFEIYRNTPGEVPKEKLVTELYLPII